MREFQREGKVGRAAMKAGMNRKTARKYLKLRRLPSELQAERTWRTRQNPFEEDWDDIRARLKDAPELEAKTLFEFLMERRPGRYQPGQLRTFQRHVKCWRAQEGPPKEVFFPQLHRPGEAIQTDFTHGTELGVTIGGEVLEHLLCNVVLPYSNWQWVTVCRSESLAALRHGIQEAVFKLGYVSEYHQTDNSSAATHRVDKKKREFNEEYLELMRHLGMKPRTIGIGQSHQNGDVEALGGSLKRRLKQHLLLRGSRDFESVPAYQAWLVSVIEKGNLLRQDQLKEELAVMRRVTVTRLPAHKEIEVPVTSASTIRVKNNTYSVPSRLRKERVRVRVYDERLEVWFGQRLQLTLDRLQGKNKHAINYRHIIWSLVRKPGAFERYRYREALFPTLNFRKAYDQLSESLQPRQADIDYLRILHLAASTMESEVESALELLLESGQLCRADTVKALVVPEQPTMPELEEPKVDLGDYDSLLEEMEVA